MHRGGSEGVRRGGSEGVHVGGRDNEKIKEYPQHSIGGGAGQCYAVHGDVPSCILHGGGSTDLDDPNQDLEADEGGAGQEEG